jgi:hypothetical protein
MDPLLGKDLDTNNEKTSDREMGVYIKPVSGQRLSKHVIAATVTHTTVENEVLSRRSEIRNWGNQLS